MTFDVRVEGLAELDRKLRAIKPAADRRIVGGALRQAGEAVAQEANRRIHSITGAARTVKAYVGPRNVWIGPGSRAAFFSMRGNKYVRGRPVMEASFNAQRSRVDNVMHDAVEAGTREALR